MLTEQEYKNNAVEYVRAFFYETELFAMLPVSDESATSTQDILVVVKANNYNYDVIMNADGEVLDCQQK